MDFIKSSRIMVLVFVVLFATFQGSFSQSNKTPWNKTSTHPMAANAFGSLFFPLTGNVYPLGYYSAKVYIGNPPKVYNLDIDSGSNLTWVQCDAPCKGCTVPPDRRYKPKNFVTCADPLCPAVPWPIEHPCVKPSDPCDYLIEYAGDDSCLGVLVKDNFPLKFTSGSVSSPSLTFGCGYDIVIPSTNQPTNTAGVLGLGSGKITIVSQLHALGLTRNVIGHCLSGQGGGYLFIGNDLVPSSGIVWTPILSNLEKYYLTGPAELFLGGKTTGEIGLQPIFDCGSSYTYFNSQVYQTVVNLVREDLNGKPLKEVKDVDLSLCWKDAKPIKSIQDVKNYFKPLVLSFTNGRNVQLQIPPENYLLVTKSSNVCLGILNGTEIGLQDLNVIGDISMQDKLVIYDNEKQQVGWVPANCNRVPKS